MTTWLGLTTNFFHCSANHLIKCQQGKIKKQKLFFLIFLIFCLGTTLIMTQIDSHLCVAKKSVRGHCTLGNVWYSLSKIGMKWDSQKKKRTFLTLCDIIIIIWWQKTECVPQIVLYRREVVTLFRSVFLLNKQPCRTLRQQKNLGFFFAIIPLSLQ